MKTIYNANGEQENEDKLLRGGARKNSGKCRLEDG